MIEAVCRKCGETFIPSPEDGAIHFVTADGAECGGMGTITRGQVNG